jgi:DedD protein
MKLLVDDRVKHRLIGIVVLLAILIILLPSMIRHSNQRFDEKMKVSIHLPPKPPFPEVAEPNPKRLLKTVKSVDVAIQLPAPVIAQTEPSFIPRVEMSKPTVIVAAVPPIPVIPVSVNPVALPKIAHDSHFSVQVASFMRQGNAQSLVSRVRAHGFQAKYNKQAGYYKVFVGDLRGHAEALLLKEQLAKKLALNGMVVKTA